MINLSQIVNDTAMRSTSGPKAARQTQSRRLHGIDFKNPFTMSKRAFTAQYRAANRIGSRVFIESEFGNAADALDRQARDGGASRDRTDDLMLAKQPLSHLSYGPWKRLVEDGGPSRS